MVLDESYLRVVIFWCHEVDVNIMRTAVKCDTRFAKKDVIKEVRKKIVVYQN